MKFVAMRRPLSKIAVSDWLNGKCHGSYFLSVDCLMWAINFKPASVVVCGVSVSGDSPPYSEQCTISMDWHKKLALKAHGGKQDHAAHAMPQAVSCPKLAGSKTHRYSPPLRPMCQRLRRAHRCDPAFCAHPTATAGRKSSDGDRKRVWLR